MSRSPKQFLAVPLGVFAVATCLWLSPEATGRLSSAGLPTKKYLDLASVKTMVATAMTRTILALALATLVAPIPVSTKTAKATSASQQFIGTWKLLSYVREEIPSGAKSDVLGPHPSGYINYGPDGRMMIIIVAGDRKKPAGSIVTPEESQVLISSMLSYAGTYSVDSEAKTVTHRVDVSWNESRTGETYVRNYQLDGDKLILTTSASTDPVTGKKSVRTLVWQKLK
jgi:hypothetical protein